MVTFAGISHVSLTVRDLARSTAFYTETLDFVPVLGSDEGRVCLHVATGFTLGLMKPLGGAGNEFTELNTGLDHIGLTAQSREELVAWEARLASAGAEFTPIRDMDLGYHLNFRDPDNIALELFAPNDEYAAALEYVRTHDVQPDELRQLASSLLGDSTFVLPHE